MSALVRAALAAALPTPVARFAELTRDHGPARVDTVAMHAGGRMVRPGLPAIPLEFTMTHRLGYEFVHEIRLGRGRLSIPFGLDAYVDGHGLMRIGPSLHAGPSFDQGALVALWGEALCYPSAWERRTDVRWEPVDDVTATLVVPGPEGPLPIRVRFDERTGFPTGCEAERYKADGPKVGWRGLLGDWRAFDGGVLAPARFGAHWADEAVPWLELWIRRVVPNVPVDTALERGRRVLARRAARAA